MAKQTCTQCPFCSGDGVVEEIVALTNESLKSVTGSNLNELQFKLTSFVVHSTLGLCTLEEGKIENGNQIFACGLLSNIFDDEKCRIPVKMIGKFHCLDSIC